MSHIPFILRTNTKGDDSFIYNSYLKSFHDHYPMKYVPDTLYFKPQTDVLDFLLDTATCMVACFPEDPEQIIGWILYQEVSEALVIHYMYIKSQHRNCYTATDMIVQVLNGHTLVIATHCCDNYQTLKYKIPNCKVIYDPYLIDKLRDLDAAR